MSLAPHRRRASLTGRLLGGMVLPMAGLALLLGIGGAVVVRASVQTVNDRILAAASRAIADSLAIDEGEVELNLSPAIFGMIEDQDRDNVFYAVRQGRTALTGYADLPDIAPGGLEDLQVRFGTATYRGQRVRIVAEGRRLPGVAAPLVVEVAETTDTRERTVRRLLLALAGLEAALIVLAAVLLPVAVRWGLRPLARVRAAMDARTGADLTPLPLDGVPAELGDLVIAFNRLLGRLDAALQGVRRFTADASHQMRTPLSILRTHIALLRGAGPAAALASIDDIDQASERLQRLLVQLLALARADSAASEELPLAEVDLCALARTVAAEYVPAAVAAGVDLRFEGDAPVHAVTHAALAAELLGNLIDNAVRYGGAPGIVAVTVEEDAAGARIVVEDDGPGIPVGDRERVFGRFVRLDRDQPVGGSGLGLPIARMLAGTVGATLTLADARGLRGLRAEIAFLGTLPGR